MSEKALFDDNYAFFFSNFIYKGICCGYSFELHRQVDAIQMSTHNICLYKEVKKKYTGCYLKTTEFLDCALIGVCAVIRSNTVTDNSSGPHEETVGNYLFSQIAVEIDSKLWISQHYFFFSTKLCWYFFFHKHIQSNSDGLNPLGP